MTDYTITYNIDSTARAAGLARATAAFNATLPDGVTPLTEAQYLTFIATPEINRWLDGYAEQYSMRTLSRKDFLARFPATAIVAIDAAAAGNADLYKYRRMLDATTDVTLSDPATVGGIGALVAAGLLTAEQGAAILEM